MNGVIRFGYGTRDFGTVRGIRITPDEQVTLVELQREQDGGTLFALREAIDCDVVDCVGLMEGLDMWLDEEGLFGAEYNPLASVVAWPFLLAQGVPQRFLQHYYGTVVLLGVNNKDGETHTMPTGAATLLQEAGFPGITSRAVADLYESIDTI